MLHLKNIFSSFFINIMYHSFMILIYLTSSFFFFQTEAVLIKAYLPLNVFNIFNLVLFFSNRSRTFQSLSIYKFFKCNIRYIIYEFM